MNLTLKERETTIVFNDEEAHATIWSCQKSFKRKMEKLGFKADRKEQDGFWYHIPKKLVSIRRGIVLSDEERGRRALRLKDIKK